MATTTYPTTIQRLVDDHGIEVNEVKGNNGRRIFVCVDPNRTPDQVDGPMLAAVEVRILDVDDFDVWFAASGPTVESVESYVRSFR